MIKNLFLSIMPLTAPVAEEGWKTGWLVVVAVIVLFFGFLFARKAAFHFTDWLNAGQPKEKFAQRFIRLFYDWGTSRANSKESLRTEAKVTLLVFIEILLAMIIFSLPFILHKFIILFFVGVIVFGCALFTAKTAKVKCEGETMPLAYVMPLQLYAVIKIIFSILTFAIVFVYEFFKSAIVNTSTVKAPVAEPASAEEPAPAEEQTPAEDEPTEKEESADENEKTE